jgi:hypothetical protein
MKRLRLPDAPAEQTGSVKAWTEPVVIPRYHPLPPDKNPMFLEKRVYQGSSGPVYPLPFTDRISTDAVEHTWQAVHLENEFLHVMVGRRSTRFCSQIHRVSWLTPGRTRRILTAGKGFCSRLARPSAVASKCWSQMSTADQEKIAATNTALGADAELVKLEAQLAAKRAMKRF